MKTGDYKQLETSAFKLTLEGKERICVIAHDITERKEVENKLKNHYDLEHLSARLSAEFVNISIEEIDDKITNSLKEIASTVDRPSAVTATCQCSGGAGTAWPQPRSGATIAMGVGGAGGGC